MSVFDSRVPFLLAYSLLLTVTGGLPVTDTTTSPETDGKLTGTLAADVNASRPEAGDSKRFSLGEFPEQPLVDSSPEASQGDETGHGRKADDARYQSCRIANTTYQHREQIPRTDPCEMCVCVDSEMYCFWKLCTLRSFTTTLKTNNISPSPSPEPETPNADSDEDQIHVDANHRNANEVIETSEKYSKILTDQRKYNILKKLEEASYATSSTESSSQTESAFASQTAAMTVSTTPTEPVVCYVMGVTYKYGEVLPKETGTCLECACSDGGRVTCAPKDCVSQPDLDYLSHNNNMDLFDIDTF